MGIEGSGSSAGICPGCGVDGPALEPCSLKICGARGLHRVPARWAGSLLRADPLIGQRIAEAVVVAATAGAGPLRRVLAISFPEGQPVELSLVRIAPDDEASTGAARGLASEVEAGRDLKHPAVLRFEKVGKDAGHWWALRYVGPSERTLEAELQRRRTIGRPMRQAEVLAIVRPLAQLLDEAVAAGMLHLELSPAAIVVTGPDLVATVPLLRGLGRARHGDAIRSQAFGCMTYGAPEQFTGYGVGRATDLYALALITFELLTLRRPFGADSNLTVRRQPFRPDVAFMEPGETLSPQVAAFFARALAPRPGDRFPDGAAFSAALNDAFTGRWIPDVPPPVAPKVADAGSRRLPWASRTRATALSDDDEDATPTIVLPRRVEPMSAEGGSQRTIEIDPDEDAPAGKRLYFSPSHTMDLGGFGPRPARDRVRPEGTCGSLRQERAAPEVVASDATVEVADRSLETMVIVDTRAENTPARALSTAADTDPTVVVEDPWLETMVIEDGRSLLAADAESDATVVVADRSLETMVFEDGRAEAAWEQRHGGATGDAHRTGLGRRRGKDGGR